MKDRCPTAVVLCNVVWLMCCSYSTTIVLRFVLRLSETTGHENMSINLTNSALVDFIKICNSSFERLRA